MSDDNIKIDCEDVKNCMLRQVILLEEIEENFKEVMAIQKKHEKLLAQTKTGAIVLAVVLVAESVGIVHLVKVWLGI